MLETVLAILATFGLGGIAGWWLTQRLGLEIAHKHRIIEEQTKRLHEYIIGYYLPHIVFSEALEQLLRGGPSLKNEPLELQLCFFRLAQWFHCQYKWAREIGGIFILLDITAEELLKHVWHGLRRFFGPDTELSVVEYHAIAGALEDDRKIAELFSEFQRRLNEEPLRSVFQKFQAWLDATDISALTQELRCYHRLFLFEINVCYQPWYKTKPGTKKVEEERGMVEGKLTELVSGGQITQKQKENYLKKIATTEQWW